MDGLAASMAQQPGAQALPTVEEVAAMLMEGVPPEQLEQQGIPPEIIMQAITMLEQQMAAQQAPQQPVEMGGGLAQSVVG